ncbi:hypothetical protein CDD83_8968 [Cordyceps sp. RAO-2017]|nr:hypothetical protein CDD83_8968 [Cordyceps sp. RAO-2017]
MKRLPQHGKGAPRAFDSGRPAFASALGAASAGTPLSYLAEPPSFAAVSDPNVVVSLKNVLKKDTTTKTKALEELLHHVHTHPFEDGAGVDDALLDIWAQIYPRISIDNSRRVRELSHSLQLQLMKSARKRMERHMPKIVGAWLSGLYDRDRVVVRAAQESLSFFLNTPEKVAAFWTKCQSQILDYALDAAQETQETLSDERTTTAEDAQAKYHRVLVASISLILGLLQHETGVAVKSRQKLDAFFEEDVVWKSITFSDSQVRKTVCHLLLACLDRRLPYAESTKAKQAFLTGGLKTSQSGSALEYVRALTRLTQRDPGLWAASPGSKKSPLSRLQLFVAKGSQGSPPKYWESLDQLLAELPEDGLTGEIASGLLSALKSGITSREEPRTNTSFSWKCYVDAARRCLRTLSDDDRMALARQHLFPLLEQFIFSVSEKQVAIPTGPNAMTVLVEVHLGLVQSSTRLAEATADEWSRLGTALCAEISASLPEVSGEFQASQTKIGEQGRRWFGLVGALHGRLQELAGSLDCTSAPSDKVISQCITVLENRNLKPFGAAQSLEYALSTASHLFATETGGSLTRFLQQTAKDDMEKAILSPSSRTLFSCLNLLGTLPELAGQYETIWQLWMDAILDLSSQALRNTALARLVSQERAAPLAIKCPRLQEAIYSQAIEAVEGADTNVEGSARTLVEAAIANRALDAETSRQIAGDMVAALEGASAGKERVLEVLEIIARRQPELFSQREAIRTDLVAHLLSLSEIADSAVSPRATRIRSLLDGDGEGALPVVEIIHANLERAGPQSLEINTLVAQAKRAVDSNARWEDAL